MAAVGALAPFCAATPCGRGDVLERLASSSASLFPSTFNVSLKLSQSRTKNSRARVTSRCHPICAASEIYVEGVTKSTEIPSSHKAWLYREYGSKENLSFTEIALPEPQPDQVLIKVKAAALNPVDSKRRAGKFQKTDSPLPITPCYDLSGVVVQVGSSVSKFRVGDEVYGDTSEFCLDGPKQFGTLAQYAVSEEKLLALKPKNLTFEEAASLPLALETAYQGWRKAGIKEGDKVLVLGGTGGVGTLAVQLAKQVFKASTVAATGSTGKLELLKSLGVDVVIDYTKTSLDEWPEKYDVVFDTAGKGEGPKVVKPDGGLVVITGPVEPPGFRYVIVSTGADLEELNSYLESGALRPVLDPRGPFPFSDAIEAFGYLEEGHAAGKIVIAPID